MMMANRDVHATSESRDRANEFETPNWVGVDQRTFLLVQATFFPEDDCILLVDLSNVVQESGGLN